MHDNVISGNYFSDWASMHNKNANCLIGLIIKFDPIASNILFYRSLDMPMSFLAAIFTFGPPYITQA